MYTCSHVRRYSTKASIFVFIRTKISKLLLNTYRYTYFRNYTTFEGTKVRVLYVYVYFRKYFRTFEYESTFVLSTFVRTKVRKYFRKYFRTFVQSTKVRKYLRTFEGFKYFPGLPAAIRGTHHRGARGGDVRAVGSVRWRRRSVRRRRHTRRRRTRYRRENDAERRGRGRRGGERRRRRRRRRSSPSSSAIFICPNCIPTPDPSVSA